MALEPNLTTTTTTTTTTTITTTTTTARPISPQVRPNPQLSKPNDPSQPQHQNHPFLYPVSSSGRGFIPRGLRPFGTEPHHVSPSSLAYSHGVRAHLDYLNHITRHYPYPHHHHHQQHHLGPTLKALPLSPHPHPHPQQPKVAPRSAVSDSNGYKDTNTRERSRDDQYYIVRDRKVRITDDASLYALCRSWLRNGVHEENQPQQNDVMKALPKPLPASMVAGYMSNKKEEKDEDEQEENEESVEQLPLPDLLKRHIKRAKKVRARLREERLHRITRYRSRLRLLLPPPVEQFKNDTAAGN